MVVGAIETFVKFTAKLTELSEPVIEGVLEITRILYPVPDKVPAGIVAAIVPAAILVNVPIFTGVVKIPEALDNCAVKTFPDVKEPEIV